MSYRLFVDDTRFPQDVAKYFEPKNLRTEYYDQWIIVRNFKDFVAYIKKNGPPSHLSLDHDLGEDEAKKLHQQGMSKRKARQHKKTVKSGMECLKWFCDYLLENNLSFPVWYVHSMNPVGRENIESYIQSFEKMFAQSKS